MAKWYDPKEASMEHMPFGVVLDKNGQKFKTRSGENIKLMSLLDTAQVEAYIQLLTRNSKYGKKEEVKEEKEAGNKSDSKKGKGKGNKKGKSKVELCEYYTDTVEGGSWLARYNPAPIQRVKLNKPVVKPVVKD